MAIWKILGGLQPPSAPWAIRLWPYPCSSETGYPPVKDTNRYLRREVISAGCYCCWWWAWWPTRCPARPCISASTRVYCCSPQSASRHPHCPSPPTESPYPTSAQTGGVLLLLCPGPSCRPLFNRWPWVATAVFLLSHPILSQWLRSRTDLCAPPPPYFSVYG